MSWERTCRKTVGMPLDGECGGGNIVTRGLCTRYVIEKITHVERNSELSRWAGSLESPSANNPPSLPRVTSRISHLEELLFGRHHSHTLRCIRKLSSPPPSQKPFADDRNKKKSEMVKVKHLSRHQGRTRSHGTIPLRVKEDVEDVSSEMVKGCTSWMKRPELYGSRRVSDRGLPGHEFDPSTTKRPGQRCKNLSRAETSCKRGCQLVSSTSLDHEWRYMSREKISKNLFHDKNNSSRVMREALTLPAFSDCGGRSPKRDHMFALTKEGLPSNKASV
ncbi:hypothetical protein TNCV_516571 [Trichonephila clavipes]|nr:hypothetical protein TNCV_516571 [Trichonephila clavipes]